MQPAGVPLDTKVAAVLDAGTRASNHASPWHDQMPRWGMIATEKRHRTHAVTDGGEQFPYGKEGRESHYLACGGSSLVWCCFPWCLPCCRRLG